MSSLSSLNRNVLRLSGLSSGLDTESIIQTMLTTSKNRVDRQYRTQVKMEWKQQAYKDINNELRKIKDEFSTVTKQEQNLLSEMNFRKYTVDYANTNDSAYFGVSASPSASITSASLQYIKQLATADKVSSNEKVTGEKGEGLKMNDTMKQVYEKLSAAGNSPFETTIVNGTRSPYFTDSSGAQFVQFNFNGKNYKISAYATFETMLSTVNADNTDMKLSYSQLTDKFTIESKTTGKDSNLKLQGNYFLDAIGIHVVDLHSIQGDMIFAPVGADNGLPEGNLLHIDSSNTYAPSFAGVAADINIWDTSLLDLAENEDVEGLELIDGNTDNPKIRFSIGGKEYTMNAYHGGGSSGSLTKLSDLLAHVNDPSNGNTTRLGFQDNDEFKGFTLSLTADTSLAEAVAAYNASGNTDIAYDETAGTASFEFYGETYTMDGVTAATTIQDLIDHVNAPDGNMNPYDDNPMRLGFTAELGFTRTATHNATMEQAYEVFQAAGIDSIKKVDTTDPISGDSISVYEFNFNGQDYRFSSGSRISDLVSRVNNDSTNVNKVRMGYTSDGRFTLTSADGPAPGPDGITDTTQYGPLQFIENDFTRDLGFGSSSVIQQGQDAILMIDGHEISKSSNNFELDGITYSLKKTFGDPEAEDHTANEKTFSLTRDLDFTVDLIVKYVDAYNTMITKINDLLKYQSTTTLGYNPKDYYPLNDEEKAEMTEEQIEQWEERGKTGIMRNDTQLTSLLNSLRMGFYSKVPGTSLMLSDIGLGGSTYNADTGSLSASYTDAINGIININETKLRAALTDNPEQVFALFAARSENDDLDEMGLVNRVNSAITDYIQNNELVTQVDNASQIAKAKERYEDLLEAMYDEEDRLWTKFTALEKAMSSLNSQSEWIGNNMM